MSYAVANWLEGDSDDDEDYCGYESWKKVLYEILTVLSILSRKY